MCQLPNQPVKYSGKRWFQLICLTGWGLVAGVPAISAAGGTAAGEPDGQPVKIEVIEGGNLISGIFRLGKSWHEVLRPFPANDRRLLVVELTIQNRGTKPLYIYLDQTWLHIDEEDQRVMVEHAETIGERVYQRPGEVLPVPPSQQSSRVQTYDQGTLNGSQSSGVFLDLGKKPGEKSNPISQEKFIMALFKLEFNTTYLKAGQSATGLLYFQLPWNFDRPAGLQLHLSEVFGGTEEPVLALPARQ